jgi:DnaJ family protein C protein 9
MSAATIIANAFGEGTSLYDILGLNNQANHDEITAAQLRKAYYQKALMYHPDKNPNNPDANAKFQAISVAYDILKDPEKRAVYDESGELFDDDNNDNDDGPTQEGTDMWKKYFSQLFGRVTTNDIDKFAQTYKCSEEEQADVIKYYKQFRGNLCKMMDCVMLSTPQDAPRWVEDFLQPAIDRKEIPDHSKTLQKTMKQMEKKEHEEQRKRQQDNDDKDDGKQAADPEATESEDDGDDHRAGSKKKKAPPKSKKAVSSGANSSTNKKGLSKREREAAEADDLMAKIRNKNALAKRQDNILSGLAARYGITDMKDDDDDPLKDDEFAKIQAKLLKGKKKRKA